MDGALSVKNIDYGKQKLHIMNSGGDEPKITAEFPYMGKKIYIPFQTFE